MNYSIKTIARIGGYLYLINIVLGFFAIGYVPSGIIVANDPAATANNILGHESLYRLGLAAHIIILLTNIPLAVIFYDVFKVTSRRIALLVVFFSLVGTAIEAVNLLNQFTPLILLKEHNLNVFTSTQLQSLTYNLDKLQSLGFNLAIVFFGCYCISIGYLIWRSGFLPKIVGLLMTVGGACYLVNSFASFISPAVAAKLIPYILIPPGLGELTFCICLIIIGVRIPKWKENENAWRVSNSLK